jgi:hypothetical protein
MPVEGQFTIDGTGTGGATVTVIDDGADPPTVIGTATTASDGSWSVDIGSTTTVQCILEYEEGGTVYRTHSKPYIAAEVATTIVDDFERGNLDPYSDGGALADSSADNTRSVSGEYSLAMSSGDAQSYIYSYPGDGLNN